MCSVFVWEQTATCATYSINWLVFITEVKSVYCPVRTGSLNKAVCASYLKRWTSALSTVPWFRQLFAGFSPRFFLQSRADLCETCGGQSGTAIGFRPSAFIHRVSIVPLLTCIYHQRYLDLAIDSIATRRIWKKRNLSRHPSGRIQIAVVHIRLFPLSRLLLKQKTFRCCSSRDRFYII